MAVIHEHTNGTAASASPAWVAEPVRAIDPEQRSRFERYLGELHGSLGMDMQTVAGFIALFVAQWRHLTRVLAMGSGLTPEFPHPEASPRPINGHPTP